MRGLVLLAMVLFGASNVFANAPFVYNEHGHHDPFIPQVSSAGVVASTEADLTAEDMILEGVVADGQGDNMAILNGKIVKKGDKVGLYTISEVLADHVDIVKDDQRFIVKLKKRGP